jgi:hypothetical protein
MYICLLLNILTFKPTLQVILTQKIDGKLLAKQAIKYFEI